MRKIFLSIMLLLVVGLLSGQQGCESGGEITDSTGPYVGGREGLVMEFLNDAPPSSGNFQGDAIPMEVELINFGGEEVKSGTAEVKLVGAIISNSFEILPETSRTTAVKNSIDILDVTDASDIPDSDFVTLGTTKLKDSIGVSWSPVVKTQLCYPYKTYVQISNLCIPGNTRETNSDCEVDGADNLVNTGDVSGAPLQVTSIVESRTSAGVRIRVDIENQGNGYVLDTNKPCAGVSGVVANTDQKVKVIIEGSGVWDCNSGTDNLATVELRDGKGRLRCQKATGTTGRAYLDVLAATLSYNYVDTASKSIVIQTQ
jgi:hypothetical protein